MTYFYKSVLSLLFVGLSGTINVIILSDRCQKYCIADVVHINSCETHQYTIDLRNSCDPHDMVFLAQATTNSSINELLSVQN